jgi:drug/metabolite transporter (DMT)-like permease
LPWFNFRSHPESGHFCRYRPTNYSSVWTFFSADQATQNGGFIKRRSVKGIPLFSGSKPIIVATAWMIGALFSFTSMAIAARELSAHFGTFQILAIRSLIGLGIISVILCKMGWTLISVRNLKLHLLRNTAHFCGQFGWFYAIAFIPLAAVFAIEFSVPMWTMLFAAVLLGERITITRIVAVVFGVVGVLVILRPGLTVVHPAVLAVLAGAVAYGLSHTLTKKLTGQDSSLCILFYMMAIQLPLGLIPAAFDWVTPEMDNWPWFFVVGITGLTAHFCMVKAFSFADAMIVVPLDFLRLPLIALVGYAVYDERLDWFLPIGASLILVGIVINVFMERNRGVGFRPLEKYESQ